MDLVPRLGSRFPLVARDAEVELLRAALRRAESGTAGAVLISGEAGVGKSRLLAEIAEVARSSGARVFTGRCVDIGEAGFPYLPFIEVVEQVRAGNPEILATWPALGALTAAVPMEPARLGAESGAAGEDRSLGQIRHFDQLQLFDAVLGALTELTKDACLVVQLEDLHWSDPSTRDLLAFLLSRLSTQRVLIVASYRSDDLHRRHPLRALLAELVRLPAVERLDLQPFAQRDAEHFVRTLAEGEISDHLAADVAARSQGNAFYAEELVASGSTSGDGIPTVLADVLLARVEKLSPTTQRVLRAASVTGRYHVRHPTLDAVVDLGRDELEAALHEAMQHNILVPGVEDAYTFRHALLREAIYADLLPGERVRLHAAYAARLASHGGPAAGLAYHSLNANDLPTALAASVRAAKEARHKGALGAELQQIERALELWDAVDDPESVASATEFALTCQAAYAAGSAGQPERALAYMRTAVPLADEQDDPVLSADTRRQLTQALLVNGQWTAAEQAISEAWDLIKDSPPSVERAWVLAMRSRVADADAQRRSFAEAAAEDARASGSASAEADALISLAFCENREDHADQSAALLERAQQRAMEAGALDVELRARFNLIIARYEQGQLDTAARIADEGVQRAADVGLTWSPYGRQIRWMRALAHHARGDWDAAADAAAPPGEKVSDVIAATLTATGAIIKVSRGQFEAAEHDLAEIRQEWYRTEDEQIALLAGIAGAELACWQGRPESAITVVDDALEAVRTCSGERWPMGGIRLAVLGVAADADLIGHGPRAADAAVLERAVADGDARLRLAQETAERGTPRGATLGPEGQAWVLRAEAEHSRLIGAQKPEPWQAVIDAFGYGDVYQQAIARWRLAEVFASTGRRDDAAVQLAEALSVAERLGAKPLAEAVRSLGRRARIALPGAATSSVQVLTPREKSVLALVARGLTNRQAGEELFISEKTVSVHLSRVMAKLGAASRTEAVAVAYQRGLIGETTQA
ncbi:AAA family ATPase [Phytoactinopolyspora alkaliphila]|uniref:AAA family ATPase n=1 Tax=Phytoactinopolyspora alkaliphila TaxID=1783498 RepID=A0A6N9YM56_9ACTN|nr:helix-turn-helix transcriptional regulator [Phytoactinopolyspora alkaliphila]NED96141.1 AAA family ATPase [Phytoactinopolyspora alkaliphila]